MSNTSGRVTPTPPPLPRGCELICENVFDDIDAQHIAEDDDELLKRREPTMQRRGKKLVAPLSQDAREQRRYTLVLDLDETVVYARDGPLYARAYLRDLLSAIKNNFEVIVWTAGDRDYAKNVLAGINVGHVVDHLIYRHHKWFNAEDYTKDLSQLGRDLQYTIIIENTPDCVRRNPGNGIIVEDFEVPVVTDAEGDEREATPPPTSQPSSTPTTSTTATLTGAAPAATPSAAQQKTPSLGNGDSEAKADEPSPSPKPKRVTTDRTLLLLREVLEALAASGETVPAFLSNCGLLSKQTVTGCDGNEIPIYYLGTRRRRRDAGSPRKSVKANRDRASSQAATTAAVASSSGQEEASPGDAIEDAAPATDGGALLTGASTTPTTPTPAGSDPTGRKTKRSTTTDAEELGSAKTPRHEKGSGSERKVD